MSLISHFDSKKYLGLEPARGAPSAGIIARGIQMSPSQIQCPTPLFICQYLLTTTYLFIQIQTDTERKANQYNFTIYLHLKGCLWLNRHSSCTTNFYKLDAYAGTGSNRTCASMRLGCLVPADCLCFIKFPPPLNRLC